MFLANLYALMSLGEWFTAKANLAAGQLKHIYSPLSQNVWGHYSLVGTAIKLWPRWFWVQFPAEKWDFFCIDKYQLMHPYIIIYTCIHSYLCDIVILIHRYEQDKEIFFSKASRPVLGPT